MLKLKESYPLRIILCQEYKFGMTKDKPSWLSKWDWNLKLREPFCLSWIIAWCFRENYGKLNTLQVWFTKNSDSEFSNNRSMQKTSKNLGCLFSVVVPGYCLLIFLFHCFWQEPGSRNQNVGGTGWTRWTVRQGGRKLGSDQCWYERSRKEFDRPWKVLWFVCLSLEKVINFLLKVDLILNPKLTNLPLSSRYNVQVTGQSKFTYHRIYYLAEVLTSFICIYIVLSV